MAKHNIFPALLDATELGLEKKLQLVRSWRTPIHLDIVDGNFAEPRSATGRGIQKVPAGSAVHLMVKHPETYFSWANQVGFRWIITHIEGAAPKRILGQAPRSIEFSAAIKSTTPLTKLRQWMPHVSGVHVMMGPIGSYGGVFHPRMVKRIAEIHRLWPRISISCDVGLNPDTIPLVFAAGARTAVVGSYIFKSALPKKQWQRLQLLKKKL